ncbi:MAG: helix-turn-helix transcriptional regulator [Notoacmeibacter sp.]|nr:helix-turn-helix transcriptional regulator [Notoacmeibacter sp.]
MLFNAPYLRLGRIYLEAVCALDRPEPLPAELVAMMDDRSPIGDYLALEPAFVAVRAMIHARDHEYEKAWNALSKLVDEVAGDGEEFHLMLLGSGFLRTLANIPQTERIGERARSTLLELAAKLEADGKAHGLTNWSGLEGLTPRELEILQCLANGDSNKVIARKHALSPHTVKRHVANILNKLALASRGQAAAWFRDHAPAAARQG